MSERKPPSAIVNVYSFLQTNNHKLFLLQLSQKKQNVGKWTCPGGRIHTGEIIADFQTAKICEETGFSGIDIVPFTITDNYFLQSGPYKGRGCVILFNIIRITGGQIRLSKKYNNHRWVGYDELLRHNITNETKTAAQILKKHLR